MQLVLVLETNAHARRKICSLLEQACFRVLTAADIQAGSTILQREPPDLLILSLDLPEAGLRELIRRVRAERRHKATPILLLATLQQEREYNLPIDLGGDDYITRPLDPAVMVRRVRLLLRRVPDRRTYPVRLRRGELILDQGARRLSVRGESIPLTPTEFELLRLLMEKPGRVYTRRELFERVLADSCPGNDRTLDTHIRNIRCKIELDPHHPTYIQTVYRIGYRFSH